MRLIGQGERCISAAIDRVKVREVFGRKLSEFDNVMEKIAQMRAKVETCRLLVLKAASQMDLLGNKDAYTRQLLSLMKAHVPRTIEEVASEAMQMWGARGFSNFDTPLWAAYAGARWLRMADGPDEVHYRTVARLEYKIQKNSNLQGINEFPIDRSKPFRRSTDPVSPEAQKFIDGYLSKL